MKRRFIRWICFLSLVSLIFINYGAAMAATDTKETIPNGFIHAAGTKLVDGNDKEFIAKGIAFGNDVWSNPSVPPENHHTENSYKELSKMGFNSIRFYLNYGLFEYDSTPYQYKQSGWDWLDRNIAWAKKYNIKLVLNMHYPQGGFQSNGNGMELWTSNDNRTRLVSLWKEIARRYENETVIMAYDLLNEPYLPELSTEGKTIGQWKNLAKRMVSAIRTVDKNHLIIVERLNAAKNIESGESNWDPDRFGNMNFFLIKDDNIAYEFHVYEPMEFTHQNAIWIESYRGNFSRYPDQDAVKTYGEVKWEGTTFSNPKLSLSKKGWQYLKGERFKVNNPSYMFAQPTFQASNTGKYGMAWFDDITVKEYDENDKYVHTIYDYEFDDLEGWSFWQAGDSKGKGIYDSSTGHDTNGSLRILYTMDDANLSSYIDRIKLEQGHSYEVSGYALGKYLTPSAEVRIRLDFFSCDSVYTRDKDYLESYIDRYLEFGEENQVPLYLGEFGCITDAFEEDRGGECFVADMIDICKENSISFNYHAYHEESFGLYQNSAKILPAQPNQLLMDIFETKLK